MRYFETYPMQSRIRLVHPAIKLVLFTIYTALALLSPSAMVSVAIWCVVAVAIVFSARIGILRLLRLMLLPMGFILAGSLTVMVEIAPDDAWFQIQPFGVALGISPAGFQLGVQLFLRSCSAIAVLYALVLNTTIGDLLFVLRKVKVPAVLLEIMVLVYRNIFILSDTANNIYTSQKSRLGYRNLQTSLQSTALLGGRLFVLANGRADQLYRSMESRCYNGNIETLPVQWCPNYTLLVMALLVAAVFAFTIFSLRFYFG